MSIFKHWFRQKAEQIIDDCKNPWAGLASYEDPAIAERILKFCGRDDDSYDMAKLIMGNVFVTLYGKSGIGKTSLLNAGVFPELRQGQYTPISLRLGMRDKIVVESYQNIITQAIIHTFSHIETLDVIEEQKDTQTADFLWNFFVRHRFFDNDGKQTIPVIVLDQFEEVFRSKRTEAETLLRQIDYLNDKDHFLDSCIIDGVTYHYETNYRFVAAIREDDLYRLEDCIDNCMLPALKRCRYRLHSLTEQGARDAILIPGKGLFNDEEAEIIAKGIIEKSRNLNGHISTNIISLLCSRIYSNFILRHNEEQITYQNVYNFIIGNPFEVFYQEAMYGFSDSEKKYIEDNLVDDFGRRNSVSEEHFSLNIPDGERLLRGSTRILQRVSVSSGSNYRIELIHDCFCSPIIELKEKRLQRHRYQLYAKELGIAIFLLIIAWIYISQLQHTNSILEKREVQSNVSMVKSLVDKGDSYTARLLALELLGNNIRHLNNVHIPEMESLIRYTNEHNNAIIQGHSAAISYVALSPDGDYFATSSYDKTIKVWDIRTGTILRTIKQNSLIDAVCYTPDAEHIVTGGQDGIVNIWNVMGKHIMSLKGHTNHVNHVTASPNGEIIATASDDKTIRLWKPSTRKCIKILKGHVGGVTQVSFSPNGKSLLSSSEDGTIRLWKISDGSCLKIFSEHSDKVLSVEFSPDGLSFMSTSADKTIKIWDIQSDQSKNTLIGHTDRVTGGSFSPDGKYIATGSYDTTIRLWNVENGSCMDVLKGHTMYVCDPMFTNDGRRIVSGSVDCTTRIWDIPMLQKTDYSILPFSGKVVDARFGSHIRKMIAIDNSNDIQLLYHSSKSILHGHTQKVNAIACSGRDDIIASGANDSTVRLWNIYEKKCIRVIKNVHAIPNYLAFSDDGEWLTAALSNGYACLIDMASKSIVKTLNTHDKNLVAISFNPDNNTLVAILSSSGVIYLWDTMNNQCIKTIKTKHKGLGRVLFSQDGKSLFSCSSEASGTIEVWDVSTGNKINAFYGHTAKIYDLALSSDGNYLASASHDHTIRIWDTLSGICVLSKNIDQFRSISFSPSDRSIMVVSINTGQVLNIEFPTIQKVIANFQAQFGNRTLTDEEKMQYFLRDN